MKKECEMKLKLSIQNFFEKRYKIHFQHFLKKFFNFIFTDDIKFCRKGVPDGPKIGEKHFLFESEFFLVLNNKKIGKSVCKLSNKFFYLTYNEKTEFYHLSNLKSLERKEQSLILIIEKDEIILNIKLSCSDKKTSQKKAKEDPRLIVEWSNLLSTLKDQILYQKKQREDTRSKVISQLENFVNKRTFKTKTSSTVMKQFAPLKTRTKENTDSIENPEKDENAHFYNTFHQNLIDLKKNSDLTYLETFKEINKIKINNKFKNLSIDDFSVDAKSEDGEDSESYSTKKKLLSEFDPKLTKSYSARFSRDFKKLENLEEKKKTLNGKKEKPNLLLQNSSIHLSLDSQKNKKDSQNSKLFKEILVSQTKSKEFVSKFPINDSVDSHGDYNNQITFTVEHKEQHKKMSDNIIFDSNDSLFNSTDLFFNSNFKKTDYQLEFGERIPKKIDDSLKFFTKIKSPGLLKDNDYSNSLYSQQINLSSSKKKEKEFNFLENSNEEKFYKSSLDKLPSTSSSINSTNSYSNEISFKEKTENNKKKSNQKVSSIERFLRGSVNVTQQEPKNLQYFWNQTFQTAIESIHKAGTITSDEILKFQEVMSSVETEFINYSKRIGETIINELYVPLEKKTIKPSKVGGIIGNPFFFIFFFIFYYFLFLFTIFYFIYYLLLFIIFYFI